jgi:hypothetical protein
MRRKIELKNNFASFKEDFTRDTGLYADDNMETYIHYVNARLADYIYQMNVLTTDTLEKLPDQFEFLFEKPLG